MFFVAQGLFSINFGNAGLHENRVSVLKFNKQTVLGFLVCTFADPDL